MLRTVEGGQQAGREEKQADERAVGVQSDSRGGVGGAWAASMIATRVRQDWFEGID